MAGFSKKKSFFSWLLPSKKWRATAIVGGGIFIGLGFYVIKLSNAASYLSDDPKACINCHVMTPQYITWKHSSHREVASCNDCHVPQDNFFRQYYFKASDGLYHATIFTLREEPEVIQARKPSMEVIQENCIRCHTDQVTDAKLMATIEQHDFHRTERTCWECHREVPHGRVKSLSAVGYQIEPIETKEEVVPKWLKDYIQNVKEEADTLPRKNSSIFNPFSSKD
jgi:cytochrome c nitrite reductase small subunit